MDFDGEVDIDDIDDDFYEPPSFSYILKNSKYIDEFFELKKMLEGFE